MTNEIRILLLEDDLDDALLNELVLRGCGLTFSFERVQTRDAFIEHLEKARPDLILADHTLPAGFGGFEALDLAQTKRPDVPFIFVTGTLGDEVAIDSLNRGATDYVLKTRLSHLVPAVHRALREADERAERKRAEESLSETTEQLRMLTDYLRHVREEEQARISRRIQKDLGQTLTRLQADMAWVLSHASGSKEPLRAKITEMAQMIDSVAQKVDGVAADLKSSVHADLYTTPPLEFPAPPIRTSPRFVALAGPC